MRVEHLDVSCAASHGRGSVNTDRRHWDTGTVNVQDLEGRAKAARHFVSVFMSFPHRRLTASRAAGVSR